MTFKAAFDHFAVDAHRQRCSNGGQKPPDGEVHDDEWKPPGSPRVQVGKADNQRHHRDNNEVEVERKKIRLYLVSGRSPAGSGVVEISLRLPRSSIAPKAYRKVPLTPYAVAKL